MHRRGATDHNQITVEIQRRAFTEVAAILREERVRPERLLLHIKHFKLNFHNIWGFGVNLIN